MRGRRYLLPHFTHTIRIYILSFSVYLPRVGHARWKQVRTYKTYDSTLRFFFLRDTHAGEMELIRLRR